MPQKPSQASKAYSDSHAYIPPHVQEAMTKQMEHMAPAHMKQYAGAFVQQQVSQGRTAPSTGKMSGPPPGYRPVTNLPRKDHFHQYKVQTPSKAGEFLNAPASQQAASNPDNTQVQQPEAYPASQPQPTPPPYAAAPPQPATPMPGNYAFFMNEDQATGKKNIFSGKVFSLPAKIGLVAGGIIMLVVIFNLIRGLIAGPSNYPYYLSVLQDQQSIIHITASALERQDLTTTNKNFAVTAQASVTSSKTSIATLLQESGKKVKPQDTALKISAKTDEVLNTAGASGTYNTTFNQTMKDQIDTYMKDINLTYSHTTASQARDLLKDQYHQAELLNELLSQGSAAN